jgi:hypothetical protein
VDFTSDCTALLYLFNNNGINNKEVEFIKENNQLKATIEKFWKSFLRYD